MFTFCSLQGALSESTTSQSLLELDGGVKVLIDVGWDESFDVDKLRELEKYVKNSHTSPEVGGCISWHMLTALQTSSHTIFNSPHSRDRLPYCRLCPLLQELPLVYSNPRLRDSTRHRSWTNPRPGPLCLDSCRCDNHQPRLSGRNLIRLHSVRNTR